MFTKVTLSLRNVCKPSKVHVKIDKKRIVTRAKALNLDAIHDTVHEMCKDEARHGKGFEGLYNRYFGDKK
ncbi:hypothetical protein HMPREF1981_02583 [Bacteroides pyogenes F0041]|uniref:Rubrerythrin n=1 Tax=Bacteroides pyogenes F0041 TaxID=1321819 RepID=U2DVK8_9BACE|nr:hypothetical protein HMPREF1981_02583 [Bacteroides pyogenes F0041]MBB3896069.1 rubrerythrin [Bacteroides pyogenes]SUV34247.1 putative rubrerythrin-like protein [Bacteroides pyogenes]